MARSESFVNRFLETDLPAVVESGILSLPPSGKGRRPRRALRAVLEAFARSGKPDRTEAAALLEESVSLCPDLKLQSLCRIWLRWMEMGMWYGAKKLP